MTKELTTTNGRSRPPTLAHYLRTQKAVDEFAKMLPKHFTGERFIRMCLTQVRMVKGLKDCSFESVMKCMMDAANRGLEPGRHYHFVPFKGECTGIVDWKGLVVMMQRHPDVSDVWAEIVYEGDEFEEVSGLERDLIHKKLPPQERKPGRKIIATYAVARLANGNRTFVVCTEEEFARAKQSSQTGSRNYGPWTDDEGAMKRKTAVRRLADWVPQSAELISTLDLDDQDTVSRLTVSQHEGDEVPGLDLDNLAALGPGSGEDRTGEDGGSTGSETTTVDNRTTSGGGAPAKQPGDTMGAAGKRALEVANAASRSGELDSESVLVSIPTLAEEFGVDRHKARRAMVAAGCRVKGKDGRAQLFDREDAVAAIRSLLDEEGSGADSPPPATKPTKGSQPVDQGAALSGEELTQEVIQAAAPDFTVAQLLLAVRAMEPGYSGTFAEAPDTTKNRLLFMLENDEGKIQLEQLILGDE